MCDWLAISDEDALGSPWHDFGDVGVDSNVRSNTEGPEMLDIWFEAVSNFVRGGMVRIC